jgi:hypothetical protein
MENNSYMTQERLDQATQIALAYDKAERSLRELALLCNTTYSQTLVTELLNNLRENRVSLLKG